jgi:hypothetical protein
MAMNARQQRAVTAAAEIISRASTTDVDAEAALHGIRRIMAATGLTLAEVMGAVPGAAAAGEALETMRGERDAALKEVRALKRDLADLRRRNRERMAPANEVRTAAADQHAAKVMKIIREIARGQRYISTDEIAAELSRRGVPTARGSSRWTRMQVDRVRQRAG